MRYCKVTGVLALVLVSAACGGTKDAQTNDAVTSAAPDDGAPLASTEAPAPPPPAAARKEHVENALYAFDYSYPAAAAVIPELQALLDKRLADSKADVAASASSAKAEAQKDGFPYRTYAREVDWKVVADLPGWLSLSADFYEFTGGAHGMSGFDTLVWDRRAATARRPVDFFASADALRAAIQAPFCDALDAERAKKRGQPVQRDGGQMFSECIDPAAQTLILGSSNRHAFDRIGVLVAPYEAGPYAEGSYEVTLPVTGKVMAALRPQYRSAFVIKP